MKRASLEQGVEGVSADPGDRRCLGLETGRDSRAAAQRVDTVTAASSLGQTSSDGAG